MIEKLLAGPPTAAAIAALEDHLGDPRVDAYVIATIVDESVEDLVRIDALKLLEVNQVKGAASAILDVVMESEDDHVRDFAAMAAASYMTEAPIARAMALIVRDAAQPNNLRWNAFGAIKRGPRSVTARALLRALAKDKEFETSAKRVIGEWAVAKPKKAKPKKAKPRPKKKAKK